jgi:hypothetical protein
MKKTKLLSLIMLIFLLNIYFVFSQLGDSLDYFENITSIKQKTFDINYPYNIDSICYEVFLKQYRVRIENC